MHIYVRPILVNKNYYYYYYYCYCYYYYYYYYHYQGGTGIRSVVYLAPSAFVASAASTFNLKNRILSENFALIPNTSVTDTLSIWSELSVGF